MQEIAKMACHSGYDKQDDMPFVCIHFKNVPPFQVSATDAIGIGGMLVDAAVGAISSSYFFKFLTEQMSVPEEIANVAVEGFSEYFEQRMPSAQDSTTVQTAESLDGYSDYLYDLLIKRGEAPMDINEWVTQHTKEAK